MIAQMKKHERKLREMLSENSKNTRRIVVNVVKLVAAIGGLAGVFYTIRPFYGKEIFALFFVLVFLNSFVLSLRKRQKYFFEIITKSFIVIFLLFCGGMIFLL